MIPVKFAVGIHEFFSVYLYLYFHFLFSFLFHVHSSPFHHRCPDILSWAKYKIYPIIFSLSSLWFGGLVGELLQPNYYIQIQPLARNYRYQILRNLSESNDKSWDVFCFSTWLELWLNFYVCHLLTRTTVHVLARGEPRCLEYDTWRTWCFKSRYTQRIA